MSNDSGINAIAKAIEYDMFTTKITDIDMQVKLANVLSKLNIKAAKHFVDKNSSTIMFQGIMTQIMNAAGKPDSLIMDAASYQIFSKMKSE